MFNGPKQIKYKKIKKGKLAKLEFKSTELKFGSIGLKAAESGIINLRQIEAARQAITRKAKRKLKIWIRIFPDLPITSKPSGVRMGKGKGQFSHWGARVRGGTVIFEICGININKILVALKTGGAKLPLKTKIFN
jgi:large subunit ribosomal protein L16|uniref:Ribosomal protein L16 n=1 Tax=Phaeodactylum tricornutum TaxID=2850 RepID=F1DGP9_PHATR|nr:ribosomal protein L16 [Phaeodactylum tricornutum]ADY18527.1 ribosomal protein L16 [Phaeodactylum tricornutum]QII42432.1 ribosomal protein L16 [Phaeodactylum tricornutum]